MSLPKLRIGLVSNFRYFRLIPLLIFPFIFLSLFPLIASANPALFSEVKQLMSEKKWQAAEQKLMALKTNYPNNTAVLNNLGITYFHLKKTDLSRRYFIQSIESVAASKIAFRNLLQLNQSQQNNKNPYFKTIAMAKPTAKHNNPLTPQPPKKVARSNKQTLVSTTRQSQTPIKPLNPVDVSEDFKEAAETLEKRPVLSLDELDSSDDLYSNLDDSDSSNGYLAEIDKEIDSEIDFNIQSDVTDADAAADSYLQDLFSQDAIVLDQKAPPPPPKAKRRVVTQAANTADKKMISQRLKDWGAAWSSGDVDNYLSYYSTRYSPPKRSRKRWVQDRRRKVTPEKQISVTISQVKVSQSSDPKRLITQFRQKYQAKTYADNTRKEIHWQKQNNQWVIVKERSL